MYIQIETEKQKTQNSINWWQKLKVPIALLSRFRTRFYKDTFLIMSVAINSCRKEITEEYLKACTILKTSSYEPK